MTFPFTMDASRSAAIALSAAAFIACALSAGELHPQVDPQVDPQVARQTPPTATTSKQLAPGLLYRPVFSSRQPDRGTIELWDLLIGPGIANIAELGRDPYLYPRGRTRSDS